MPTAGLHSCTSVGTSKMLPAPPQCQEGRVHGNAHVRTMRTCMHEDGTWNEWREMLPAPQFECTIYKGAYWSRDRATFGERTLFLSKGAPGVTKASLVARLYRAAGRHGTTLTSAALLWCMAWVIPREDRMLRVMHAFL